MSDKIFIDTNIFVYAFLDTDDKPGNIKHQKSVNLLKKIIAETIPIISTQVLTEYYSALVKNKIKDDIIQRSAKELTNCVDIVPLTKDTVIESYAIKNKYGFSHWDSLIVAAALNSHCTVLYTEDMQHDQLIENQLRILNPL
jgi:predicted nucleic acid-binding protein